MLGGRVLEHSAANTALRFSKKALFSFENRAFCGCEVYVLGWIPDEIEKWSADFMRRQLNTEVKKG
jgi:hypothetical protein